MAGASGPGVQGAQTVGWGPAFGGLWPLFAHLGVSGEADPGVSESHPGLEAVEAAGCLPLLPPGLNSDAPVGNLRADPLGPHTFVVGSLHTPSPPLLGS